MHRQHTHTCTGTDAHTTQRSMSNIIMMQIKVFLCIKLFTWTEMLNEQEPMRISSFSWALQAESRACVRTYICVCLCELVCFMWETIDWGDRIIWFKNRFACMESYFPLDYHCAKVNQSSSTYHPMELRMEIVLRGYGTIICNKPHTKITSITDIYSSVLFK